MRIALFLLALCAPLCAQPIVEIAVDTDVEFFEVWGDQAAHRLKLTIIDEAGSYFDAVGITIVPTTVLIRTTEPDPYSAINAFDIFDEFRSVWESDATPVDDPYRDVALLVTGKNMTQAAGLGQTTLICSEDFGQAVAEGFSSLTLFGLPNTISGMIIAHEVAHVIGAFHDEVGSPEPNTIMWPVLTNQNQPVFSQQAIDDMFANLANRTCDDTPEQSQLDWPFVRGDVDDDRSITLLDAVLLLGHLFGSVVVGCEDSVDVDDDGTKALTDAIYLLAYLFDAGTPPPAPFSVLGNDPTPDSIPCGWPL